ncbi:hypothetical protein BJ912DRAFT_1096285 [Pholiota molesta]|nr:hypothetical protein BJ912DRAFT_1096285 [Pholiota molesta]
MIGCPLHACQRSAHTSLLEQAAQRRRRHSRPYRVYCAPYIAVDDPLIPSHVLDCYNSNPIDVSFPAWFGGARFERVADAAAAGESGDGTVVMKRRLVRNVNHTKSNTDPGPPTKQGGEPSNPIPPSTTNTPPQLDAFSDIASPLKSCAYRPKVTCQSSPTHQARSLWHRPAPIQRSVSATPARVRGVCSIEHRTAVCTLQYLTHSDRGDSLFGHDWSLGSKIVSLDSWGFLVSSILLTQATFAGPRDE